MSRARSPARQHVADLLDTPSMLIATFLAATRQGDRGLAEWARRRLADRHIRIVIGADDLTAVLPAGEGAK